MSQGKRRRLDEQREGPGELGWQDRQSPEPALVGTDENARDFPADDERPAEDGDLSPGPHGRRRRPAGR